MALYKISGAHRRINGHQFIPFDFPDYCFFAPRRNYAQVIGAGGASYSLDQQRGAFRALVRNNVNDIATKLYKAVKDMPHQVEAIWKQYGGEPNTLLNDIVEGEKRPSLNISDVASVPLTISGRKRIGATGPFSYNDNGDGTVTVNAPYAANSGTYTDVPAAAAYWLMGPNLNTWIQGLEAKGVGSGDLQNIENQYGNGNPPSTTGLPAIQNTVNMGNAMYQLSLLPPKSTGAGLVTAGSGILNAFFPGAGNIAAGIINSLGGGTSGPVPSDTSPNYPPPSRPVIGIPVLPIVLGAAAVGTILFLTLSD